MIELLFVILHLQEQTFAFTGMEVVPRCVRANWDLPTAPVCHNTSYQLTVQVACPLMLRMEQQVI